MKIEPAEMLDLEPAALCLAKAFAADPLLPFFFPAAENPNSVVAELFGLLLKALIKLAMPIRLSRHMGDISGVVMGYDTRRLDWPADVELAFEDFLRRQKGASDRFHNYETASKRFKPSQPHYYLGVLGVDPARHGKGEGLALVDAFCSLSESDSTSTGTYLETANPLNLGFYGRCGFTLTGEHELDAVTRLYCLFRPSGNHASV